MPVEVGAFEDGVLALRAEPNASHFCRWREGSLDATLLTLDALGSNAHKGSIVLKNSLRTFKCTFLGVLRPLPWS